MALILILMTQRLVISSIIISSCCGISAVSAQILPDGTTDTSVINDCQSVCEITGGIEAEQNLFHSFQEFNIPSGGSAYFADPGVERIFSRITGSNPSTILGTLGISGGDADLFLLNPNGIIFGEGAELDLNGSFFATTADEIKFGQQGSFSATPQPQEDLALLTITPSALWFNQVEPNGAIIFEQANIILNKEQHLSFVGQQSDRPGIEFHNSTIDFATGNISLGAVGNQAKKAAEMVAEVSILENSELEFGNTARGDISITDGSVIRTINLSQTDDSIANQIHLESNNLEITGNSTISTITIADQGTDIKINAQSSVKISGTDDAAFQEFVRDSLTLERFAILRNGLETNTSGTGDAGDIEITTPNLLIERGAGVVSATNDQGKSGNLNLNVKDNLSLRGSGLLTGSNISRLGHVGEINIETGKLLVEKNSIISSSTLGDGNAGSLSIKATEAVEIKDTLAEAIIPTGVFTNTVFGSGKGGNLKITTPRLTLHNGGLLSASSGTEAYVENELVPFDSGGTGGNIDLEIGESIEVKGKSLDGRFPSSILSETLSPSPAGSLKIDTGSLSIDSDGFISTSSLADGAGGNIAINARKAIELEGAGINNLQQLIRDGLRGELNPDNVKGGIAAFAVGNGSSGTITISTSSLDLNQGAIISTATYGNDDAGDLEIDADQNINVTGSAIISPTFGEGEGGRIGLKTKNLNITKGGAVASASLGSGRAGNINIEATESIAIFDIIPGLLFSGSISTGNYSGRGLSGDLNLSTQRLTIRDGANIETNNVFLNPHIPTDIDESQTAELADPSFQGKLTINASELIEISGSLTEANSSNSGSNSHISSITNTSNPASDITINTGKLTLDDRGTINVSSLGDASAGKLRINADSVSLKDNAQLRGTTRSGQGGDIDLQIGELLQIDNLSLIDTNAIAEGNGGNINIVADFVVATRESTIAANAKQEGQGGNISITAKDVFLSADSTITADSALGIDGTVEVKTLTDSERNNLTRLPQHVIQADSRIVTSCSSQRNSSSTFTHAGRGGLPHNPFIDSQAGNVLIADLDVIEHTVSPKQFLAHNETLELIKPKLAEANQWRVNHQGQIEFVAVGSRSLFAEFDSPHCSARS
ncbi:MAG: filamentous hemagglutinin N-terminal domain-containing protein [Cyanobacteria bacterium J06643_13]